MREAVPIFPYQLNISIELQLNRLMTDKLSESVEKALGSENFLITNDTSTPGDIKRPNWVDRKNDLLCVIIVEDVIIVVLEAKRLSSPNSNLKASVVEEEGSFRYSERRSR